MATFDLERGAEKHPTVDKIVGNVAKLEDLFTRLTRAMTTLKTHDHRIEAPDPTLFQRAAQAYWSHAAREPADFLRSQVSFWGSSLINLASMQSHALMMKPYDHDDSIHDRRFEDPAWDKNPFLHMIMQQYRINAEALTEAVEAAEDLDSKEKQRLSYFAEQIVNLSAPSNFLPTNPEALQKALDSEGTSLIDGLENLVNDLEANDGELLVRLADEEAFKLGENIATTPGDVIFRNEMMELIQYSAATDEVHETPIVLFPPWINRFYILDLKEKNSLIKWITEQGYTLFVVSWVNPDARHAEVGLEDYIESGMLTA
ncbi:MAG: class I poly(R)-hydroxyalkanoic acid synthase, partial [Pseudomonadota bacterium]